MSLHTLPDGTLTALPTLPAATAPTSIVGATDAGTDVHAVVTVQYAMTRDMLAVALDLACCPTDSHPDDWTVEYIRESVEMELSMSSVLDLERDSGLLLGFLDGDDDHLAAWVRAEYRAIDRAYPRLAPKGYR